MMKQLDDWLNSFTMYTIVLYSLLALLGVSWLLSLTGSLSYSIGPLVGSALLLVGVSHFSNVGLAKLYRVPANLESSLITGLILYFVMVPPSDTKGWLALMVAALAAVASKYILTWKHAVIFNPAAVGAVVVSVSGIGLAGWWIASRPMFLFSLLAAVIVLRRLRRFMMFAAFIIPAVGLNVYWLHTHGFTLNEALQNAVVTFPALFLGTFMLTEPASMPKTNFERSIFALLIGTLFASHIRLGDHIAATPHMVLLLGNVYAFLVSRRTATRMMLKKKTKIAPDTYDFAFEPEAPLHFLPGQYMEWTLDEVKVEARGGNRRTFTIASSPHEPHVHLAAKFYTPSSAFKQRLLALKPGENIYISQQAGDFVLPQNTQQKLVWIAGGIGVTPFRAMASDMILKKEKRDVTLLYSVNSKEEIAYAELWASAKKYGVKLVPIVGERLDAESLTTYMPDWQSATFYLSGPPAMVKAYSSLLRSISVPLSHIRTDYFSGL